MASSSYYKRKRNEQADLKDKYEGWKKELEKIKKGFSKWDVTDGPKDVNKKIEKTISELQNGVKGSTTFNSHVADLYDEKEYDTDSDQLVHGAERAIEREIASVQEDIKEADRLYDYYHEKYKAARRREREAAAKAAAAAASGS